MNIYLKFCKKCKRRYDFPTCPFCRIKKEEEDDRPFKTSQRIS